MDGVIVIGFEVPGIPYQHIVNGCGSFLAPALPLRPDHAAIAEQWLIKRGYTLRNWTAYCEAMRASIMRGEFEIVATVFFDSPTVDDHAPSRQRAILQTLHRRDKNHYRVVDSNFSVSGGVK